jgi:drug/metabolite transporter (DMT)-like permease
MASMDRPGEAQRQFRGRLLVLAAALLWSTSALFAKAPVLDSWPLETRGLLLAFWRTLFGGLVLVPLIRRPRWTWRLVPSAVCFVAMNVTFLQAMTRTTGANAIWLQYTAPLWVFLAAVVAMGQAVTNRDLWMLLWGMAGVAIILLFGLAAPAASDSAAGVLWGLASGIAYAGVVLSARALRDLDPVWVVAVNHLSTALLIGPYFLVTGVWPTTSQLAWVAAFGLFQMGLPYVLFTRGVRYVTAHEAAGLALVEPVLVPLWVFLAWRHHPTYQPVDWWTLVGGAMIFVGLFVRYWPRERTKDEGQRTKE